MDAIEAITRRVVRCARCPRLRDWCRHVAATKRRAFAEEVYWGRPVPTTGRAGARLWVLGLAPAAHGANRTGRMFTGDRSGDVLYAALHRAGFASAPTSVTRDDGTRLKDCVISAAVRCAPPQNKPERREIENCRAWLDDEWAALRRVRVVLALGGLAWREAVALFRRQGALPARGAAPFAHGAELGTRPLLLGCYHVSQQNTFTGRLTPRMLDSVLRRARSRIRA